MTSQRGSASGQWLIERATTDSGSLRAELEERYAKHSTVGALAGGRHTCAGSHSSIADAKDLAGDPARELSMITVEYPPGSADPVHTHHAQALVYVLEGTI